MSKNNFKQQLETVDKNVAIEKLATDLGLKTSLSRHFLRYALANAQLFDNKQLDYGPGNIAKHGDFGVVVRTSDKLERLSHLYTNKRAAKNESIEDTFRDIANYGIIGHMFRDGIWSVDPLPAKVPEVKVAKEPKAPKPLTASGIPTDQDRPY